MLLYFDGWYCAFRSGIEPHQDRQHSSGRQANSFRCVENEILTSRSSKPHNVRIRCQLVCPWPVRTSRAVFRRQLRVVVRETDDSKTSYPARLSNHTWKDDGG